MLIQGQSPQRNGRWEDQRKPRPTGTNGPTPRLTAVGVLRNGDKRCPVQKQVTRERQGPEGCGLLRSSREQAEARVRHRRGVIVLLHPATVAPRPPGPRQRRMDRLEPIYADFFQSIL